ncbi:hypothetical protein SKAU_G00392610 [Synaphobranchus kaupii]|uniref:Uncharacterized protein n=1 Tax=Synaphobranchus kaupii TaxID=118154 RepID=A0A9Q1EBU5_SYNKA|nr:hypothetical protein SKAU_G00392610 [Synaphobranchus kaupii]
MNAIRRTGRFDTSKINGEPEASNALRSQCKALTLKRQWATAADERHRHATHNMAGDVEHDKRLGYMSCPGHDPPSPSQA